MPPPTEPRRRVNPDKAPFDRLPVIKAESHRGSIRWSQAQAQAQGEQYIRWLDQDDIRRLDK